MIRFLHQTSDTALELAVLSGVDKGVDAAVGEHQNHGEVVEPAGEVYGVTGKIQEERDLVG